MKLLARELEMGASLLFTLALLYSRNFYSGNFFLVCHFLVWYFLVWHLFTLAFFALVRVWIISHGTSLIFDEHVLLCESM